jgi:NADH-quinone oxidoreductase subunit E/NADP-reducing hydrogenase subunit HndA
MPVAEVDMAITQAENLLEKHGTERRSLIYVLQDIQEQFGYLPRRSLESVAGGLEIPLSEVLRVATFYAAFSLEPRGEHLISVCMGTACHVRGAPRIMEALRRNLDLGDDQSTTDDMTFTVESVRCLGCCGLAPAITIDGNTHGLLTPDQIPDLLDQYA